MRRREQKEPRELGEIGSALGRRFLGPVDRELERRFERAVSAQARGGGGIGGQLAECIEREAESTRVRIRMQAHDAKQHRQRSIEQRSTLGLQGGARALELLAPPLSLRGRALLEAATG